MEVYIMILTSVVIGFIMGRQTVKTPEQPQPYKVINLQNPLQAYKEHKMTKEQQKELEKYMTIADNIENYDGTGANQKDVPL